MICSRKQAHFDYFFISFAFGKFFLPVLIPGFSALTRRVRTERKFAEGGQKTKHKGNCISPKNQVFSEKPLYPQVASTCGMRTFQDRKIFQLPKYATKVICSPPK
jgi:hypothetical protein